MTDEPIERKTWTSLAEVIDHHQHQRPFSWFDVGEFFNTELETDLIAGCFFVTSEQFVGSDGQADPRRYTLRSVAANGDVHTVGRFQEYDTLAEAVAAVPRLAREALGLLDDKLADDPDWQAARKEARE